MQLNTNRNPQVHISACKRRNDKKGYPKCNKCGGLILQLQHQAAWNTFPNTLYMGRDNIASEDMDCSNGFKYGTALDKCPTGYTFKNKKNTSCNRHFRECTKIPRYDFSYTYHTVDPNDIDSHKNEQLTYDNKSNTERIIYDLSCVENGEEHKYTTSPSKSNTRTINPNKLPIEISINDCRKCKQHCPPGNTIIEKMSNNLKFNQLKIIASNSISKVKSLYR